MTAMLHETTATTDVPQLRFGGGIAGFPDSERYALVEVADAAPLCLLTSLDEEGVQFVVAPPALFFPDYAPDLDDDSAERLGLTDAADALLLVVITVGPDLATSTANLMAPVVVNTRTLAAAQVVVADDWPLRAPLRPA